MLVVPRYRAVWLPVDETPDQRRVRQWRQKAEECRTVGDQMTDATARASLHRMADSYDNRANALEGRSRFRQGPEKTG